jgi:hypothetical protein
MLTLIAQITNPVIDQALGSGTDGGASLGLLMGRLYRTAILVGGLALLLYIVWSGVEWITGGGDKGKIDAAKARLTNGIIGMAILVGTAAIAAFLGQLFGFDLLNPAL